MQGQHMNQIHAYSQHAPSGRCWLELDLQLDDSQIPAHDAHVHQTC